MKRSWVLALAAIAGIAASCGTPDAPETGAIVQAHFTNLQPLDPATEGSYQAWVYDDTGEARSLGRFTLPADGRTEFTLPAAHPRRFVLTLEPPGDSDATPSRYPILAGDFHGRTAELGIQGSITAADLPLVEHPGAHSLFTTTDNLRLGYPSHENAGLWFFRMDPWNNPHGTREVHLTPLQRAWVYEGWIVWKIGTSEAAWISFGKFRPDDRQLLTSRDNTGTGPFSEAADFRNGGVEDVPGDEWLANGRAMPLPGGPMLPFALDSVDVQGHALWHMAITIEPAFDLVEPLRTEQPFFIHPYGDAIGAGPPQLPRIIEYLGHVPAGVVRIGG